MVNAVNASTITWRHRGARFSQEPMFTLLGTPAEHKRRIVYETSHSIQRNEMIREVVNWIEK